MLLTEGKPSESRSWTIQVSDPGDGVFGIGEHSDSGYHHAIYGESHDVFLCVVLITVGHVCTQTTYMGTLVPKCVQPRRVPATFTIIQQH